MLVVGLLFVVCWCVVVVCVLLLFDCCSLLIVVSHSWFDVRCLLFVVCYVGACCVWCFVFGVWC